MMGTYIKEQKNKMKRMSLVKSTVTCAPKRMVREMNCNAEEKKDP